MVVKGFKRTLINMIVVVSLLLALCVCVDYAANATNDTIISNDTDNVIPENVIFINGSYVDLDNSSGIAKTDGKIYTDKKVKVKKNVKKVRTVSMYAKPSCGCHYKYTWHKYSFMDHCPNCGRDNCLVNRHKYGARYEQEWTCKYCDSDYCAVCGKEKFSWSHSYLKRC